MRSEFEVEIVLDDSDTADDKQAIAASFRDLGVEPILQPPDRILPLLPIVGAVLAGAAAAHALADLGCRLKAGVILDVRPDPIRITKQRLLPRGTVVLVGAGGDISVHDCAHDSIKDLVSSALSLKV
jgi:hypothetical protein